MSSCPASSYFADEAVHPMSIYQSATMTPMQNAQVEPEPQANRNSHRLVV